jgi:hypothetical protein
MSLLIRIDDPAPAAGHAHRWHAHLGDARLGDSLADRHGPCAIARDDAAPGARSGGRAPPLARRPHHDPHQGLGAAGKRVQTLGRHGPIG